MILATYIISAMRMTVQKNTNHSTFVVELLQCTQIHHKFYPKKESVFLLFGFLKIFTKTSEKIRNIVDNDNNSHVS